MENSDEEEEPNTAFSLLCEKERDNIISELIR